MNIETNEKIAMVCAFGLLLIMAISIHIAHIKKISEEVKEKKEESEMLDNQDIVNEIAKLTETERNTNAIAFIILELKELEKAVEELKEKLKAYEPKKDI